MDLDGSIFWWLGGILVLAALVLSAVGIRGKDDWPPSGGVMWGLLAVLSVIVVGTSAFAVANASEEKEHREHELAEEEAAAQENESAAAAGAAPEAQNPEEPTPTTGDEAPEGQGAGGPEESFDVTSPEDGSLVFDPDGIEAEAGTITLAYTNPASLVHNIYLEDQNDDVLAESEDVSGGESTEITAQLSPGEYVFYCAIPGHRDAGMEGVLTVE